MNDDKNYIKGINDFLEDKEKEEEKSNVEMFTRDGLIERVDKIFVTKDGKQLLKEIYR